MWSRRGLFVSGFSVWFREDTQCMLPGHVVQRRHSVHASWHVCSPFRAFKLDLPGRKFLLGETQGQQAPSFFVDTALSVYILPPFKGDNKPRGALQRRLAGAREHRSSHLLWGQGCWKVRGII